MKSQIILEMLFILLRERKVRAVDLANRFEISVRSVYRYVDELTVAGVPIDLQRGAGGGITISDAYKLPRGFMTREEYGRAIEAIRAMNEQLRDETLSSVISKLTAQLKTERREPISGNILVDGGTWGDERKFSEKLSFFQRAIDERLAVEIEYFDRGGERSKRVILPHLLVLKQNVWYVYAHCRMRGAFRLFKLGRVRTVKETGELFERIPFDRKDVPLSFWDSEKTVSASFEIAPEALPYMEEWLGVDNISKQEETFVANVVLPDDESLVGKILSLGSGLKVLSPASLAARVREEAVKIANR